MVIAVTRLIAYAIDDGKRWRRFLFFVFLLLTIAVGWWLLADSGVQVVMRDFGRGIVTSQRTVGTAPGGPRPSPRETARRGLGAAARY